MECLTTYSKIGISSSHYNLLFFVTNKGVLQFEISNLNRYGLNSQQFLVSEQQEKFHDADFLKRSVLSSVREHEVTLRMILWYKNGKDPKEFVEIDFPHDVYENAVPCADADIIEIMTSSKERLVLF